MLLREPELNFINDKAGKPVGINQHIGRRPIFAFGNSDGEREFAYDRDSHMGRLDKGLIEAKKQWLDSC